MITLTHKRDQSGTVGLELARIGSQLFVYDSATCDQTATPPLFDTFATRLSVQPLIHPNVEKRRSPKSRYEVFYSASLLDRGSDSSFVPILLVVGTSGSPLRDGRSQGWKMVEDGARDSPVRVLEYRSTRRGSGGPQKPFSWLSEGVRGVFTINTEAGEKACVPHLLILGAPSCPRG
jgi:hypothetical protein